MHESTTSPHFLLGVLLVLGVIVLVVGLLVVGVIMLVRHSSSAAAIPPPVTPDAARPHNGGMILAFGIASLVLGCFPLGIVAWIMGANDVRSMGRGEIDQSGRGMTQAGMVLGFISTAIVGLLFLFGLLVLIVKMGPHHMAQ